VLKFLSVNNIVIAAAKTGKEKTNKKAVTNIDHINKGKECIVIPGALILKTVVIKLIDPIKEAAPAKCKLKIAQSTPMPSTADKGGYTVQPVPAPPSNKVEVISKNKDGGINQKLKLFNRGNAISGAPIKMGINQLPKPDIKIGITIKKIISKPCDVTTTL
jgi:hypothetical protein